MTRRQTANVIVFPVVLALLVALDRVTRWPWYVALPLWIGTVLLAELILSRTFRHHG